MSSTKLNKQKKEKDEFNKESNETGAVKSPWYFYLILFLIPILFFLFVEVFLRIIGYGESDLKQWTTVGFNKLTLNDSISSKYFRVSGSLPTSIKDCFDADKKPNTFRVFVLGESSAAGYPYMPNGSFSKYLQKRLELVYPNSHIEVVNLGITAISSYVVLDLMEGVLEQKPDLIIVYTGHNEFYGALGVGSLESKNKAVLNARTFLEKFKTVQLLRDIIASLTSSGEESSQTKDGTLMSRMAKEQSIPYNSAMFNAGVEQFKDNMTALIEMAKEKNVPVMFGTLASNLKDLKPFISIDENGESAESVYKKGLEELRKGNKKEAELLFRKAKDLDVLRFRAPEKINEIIRSFKEEYGCPVADIDKFLNSKSKDGIVGNDLMTDHLHPTLRGFMYMGEAFYNEMSRSGLLPRSEKAITDEKKQDSLAIANFSFSQLDSVIADFRIKVLKNDWPYVSKRTKNTAQILEPKNKIDTLAYNVLTESTTWFAAHLVLGESYLKAGEIKKYIKEMQIITDQYPFTVNTSGKTAETLLSMGLVDDALPFLFKVYRVKPDAFSSKFIGSYYASINKFSDAVFYLEQSLKFEPNDAQTLYNLAGAYANTDRPKDAMDAIKRCLQIEPNYVEAQILYKQLRANIL